MARNLLDIAMGIMTVCPKCGDRVHGRHHFKIVDAQIIEKRFTGREVLKVGYSCDCFYGYRHYKIKSTTIDSYLNMREESQRKARDRFGIED